MNCRKKSKETRVHIIPTLFYVKLYMKFIKEKRVIKHVALSMS